MTEWYQKPYPKNSKPPDVALPRTLYAPRHGEGFFSGDDVTAFKRAISRAGRWPWKPQEWDDGYSDTFALGQGGNVVDTGVKGFQRQMKLDQHGVLGVHTFEAIRTSLIPKELPNGGQPLLDQTAINLLKGYNQSSGVPDLGPVVAKGKSVLNHDLTHATGGIALYPAFDDAFNAGAKIIAPEDIEVFRDSSSNPGDAFYAHGESGIDYWFGHLVSAPAVGKTFAKGAQVGVVLDHNVGGGPHVHVGVNVERIWGAGKQLQHHTNYTHGAPTVGKQLADGPP